MSNQESPDGSKTMSRPVRILIAVFACICALLAVLTTIYFLFFNVRPVDERRSEEIYQATLKRLQANDLYPRDKNGFAVQEDIIVKNANPARVEPYKALAKYCEGKIPDIRKELEKDKKATKKDIKEFTSVLPKIEEAIGRESYIIYYDGNYGLGALVPNFLTMRAIAQGLSVLGLYNEMHNRPQEAVKCYILAITYGVKIGDNGTLIDQMISLACQLLGSNPLHYLLVGGKLENTDYRHIIDRLDSLPLQDDKFLNAMDEYYVRTIYDYNTLMTTPQKSHLWSNNPIDITNNKFIIAREKVLYMNAYLECRPAFETLKMPEEIGLRSSDDIISELKKQKSLITVHYIQKYERALMHKKAMLTRLSALKIVAALQLYRGEKGEYPHTLEKLCPAYLKTLPLDYVSSDGSFCYKKEGGSFQLSSESKFYQLIHQKDRLMLYPPDSEIF